MSTLAEYVASQDNLVQEAAEALPHTFSQCTYSQGYIRQAVYLCLTCPETRGLCSACSIACHTDHEQVELFPKRKFRCDCPTEAVNNPCRLHKRPEIANDQNIYGQNFQNKFCRCGRTYDAQKEKETMIQCLACEDWFHESCCHLREVPPSREPTPEPSDTAANIEESDSASTVSSGLPLPLILADDYEAFVCQSCVFSIPILKRWAGTPVTLMVVRDPEPSSQWKVLSSSDSSSSALHVDVVGSTPSDVPTGTKRPHSPTTDEGPDMKKSRSVGEPTQPTVASSSASNCLAPPQNPIALRVLDSPHRLTELSTGAGDLFLTEGFRERWCRCSECEPSLQAHRFLLEEEDTYEPPDDPDSGLSLEELGLRALSSLPRDSAIEGIHAFNSLREDLVSYLRPFAAEGKVVSDNDITSFFDKLREAKALNASQGS